MIPTRGRSIVARFCTSDPKTWKSETWKRVVVETIGGLRTGLFQVEGGTRHFGYWPGESVELAATARNWGSKDATAALRFTVTARPAGRRLFETEATLSLAPGEERTSMWT
jgi:hypothetical protein